MSLPETGSSQTPVVKLRRGVTVPPDALEQMERAALRQGSDFTRAESTPDESTQPAVVQVDPVQVDAPQVTQTQLKPSRVKPTQLESKQVKPDQPEPKPAEGRAGALRGRRMQAYLDDETYAAVQARALELDRSDSWVAAQLIAQGIQALKAGNGEK